jgi:hypothetical protein
MARGRKEIMIFRNEMRRDKWQVFWERERDFLRCRNDKRREEKRREERRECSSP